jgi:elongation factor G
MGGSGVRTMNLAIVGHRGAGKTTLAEHLLAAGRALRQPGAVDAGTTLLDHLDDERRRHLSLQLAVGWIEWDDTLIHLIDVPGSAHCRYERALAASLADVVLVVVDAGEDLPNDTAELLRDVTRAGRPTLVLLNKMDRPSELPALTAALSSAAGVPVVAVEAVLSEGGACVGVVDLLSRRMSTHDEADHHWQESELRRWMTRPWEQLCEAVALTDDALLEDYLEYLELPENAVAAGLTAAFGRGSLAPLLYGAGATGFGVARLLDFVVRHGPVATAGPGPAANEYDGTPLRVAPDHGFTAQLLATQLDKDGQPFQVFRVWSGEAPLNKPWVHGETGASTRVRKLYRLRGPRRAAARYRGPGALLATWDVLDGRPGDTFTAGERLVVQPPERPPRMMAWALSTTTADERIFRNALNRLLTMDGALELRTDQTTGDLLLAGAGEAHLTAALDRLRGLGVDVSGRLPPIPWREVPAHAVRNVAGVHRLEDGDGLPVEFGACHVDVEPRQDETIDFEDAFPDIDELPRKFRPAIDEGVRRALRHGPTAGYPVLGAHVRLTGGEYDILQSSEDHFRIAGELAAREALARAGTRLLEPWWTVDVYVPSADVGAVIGELSSRRGRVVGMEVLDEETRVTAQMPYRELRSFGPRLDAVCAGRGRFFGEPSHYEQAPDHLVDEAIASSPFRRAC